MGVENNIPEGGLSKGYNEPNDPLKGLTFDENWHLVPTESSNSATTGYGVEGNDNPIVDLVRDVRRCWNNRT
jgi:hypothetical protein